MLPCRERESMIVLSPPADYMLRGSISTSLLLYCMPKKIPAPHSTTFSKDQRAPKSYKTLSRASMHHPK